MLWLGYLIHIKITLKDAKRHPLCLKLIWMKHFKFIWFHLTNTAKEVKVLLLTNYFELCFHRQKYLDLIISHLEYFILVTYSFLKYCQQYSCLRKLREFQLCQSHLYNSSFSLNFKYRRSFIHSKL